MAVPGVDAFLPLQHSVIGSSLHSMKPRRRPCSSRGHLAFSFWCHSLPAGAIAALQLAYNLEPQMTGVFLPMELWRGRIEAESGLCFALASVKLLADLRMYFQYSNTLIDGNGIIQFNKFNSLYKYQICKSLIPLRVGYPPTRQDSGL